MSIRTLILGFVCLLGFLGSHSLGQVTYPPRPAEGEFVVDAANLIDPQDKAKIREVCQQLQTSKGIALLAVTINSMADFGASGWQIERYAMNLFDEWGIGHSGRNTGVLVLVSKNDRKVRIEMGAAWTHDKDTVAASVINSVMVPRFKAGDYSGGIRQGVESLATQIGNPPGVQGAQRVAPSQSLYSPPPQSQALHSTGVSRLGPLACIIIPIILVVVISIISRIGRGIGGGPAYGGGYGPMGWGGGWGGGGGGGFLSGALLGGLLGNAWGSRNSGGGFFGGSSSSSSGGFGGGGFGGGGFGGGGGGSFGGGFSGGGGATGSW